MRIIKNGAQTLQNEKVERGIQMESFEPLPMMVLAERSAKREPKETQCPSAPSTSNDSKLSKSTDCTKAKVESTAIVMKGGKTPKARCSVSRKGLGGPSVPQGFRGMQTIQNKYEWVDYYVEWPVRIKLRINNITTTHNN
jgi:hypothetical protein